MVTMVGNHGHHGIQGSLNQVSTAQVKIYNFLVRHGFDPENVNLKKTTRYPWANTQTRRTFVMVMGI